MEKFKTLVSLYICPLLVVVDWTTIVSRFDCINVGMCGPVTGDYCSFVLLNLLTSKLHQLLDTRISFTAIAPVSNAI